MTYKEAKEFFESLKIISDTDWRIQPTSRSCITDSAREIEFDHELTTTELQQVCEYLGQDAFAREYGWTGAQGHKKEGNLYRFHTTWDSSG